MVHVWTYSTEWDGATTVVSYNGARMDIQHGVGWRNDCSELLWCTYGHTARSGMTHRL